MLERTAGCLESGSLRRLLPSSKQTLKSRRTLHSGFWNHAAGNHELSPLWAALVRGADAISREMEPSSEQTQSTDNGGLLLDFLYPAGTINFLRHYSGWGRDVSDTRWSRTGLAKLGQRLYSSSAKDSHDVTQETKALAQDILREKMGLTRPGDYEEAWRQYFLLEREDQQQVRSELMAYFSPSNRVLDAERTIDLFESGKPEERNATMYQMTIRAYLRLRNLEAAVLLYETSLSALRYPAGASELLAYFFSITSSSRAFGIYSTFRDLRRKGLALDYDVLKDVRKLPNFGDLVCSLITEARSPRSDESGETINISNLTEEQFLKKLVWSAILQEGPFIRGRFWKLWSYMRRWPSFSMHEFDLIAWMLTSKNEETTLARCYEQIHKKVEGGVSQRTLHRLLTIYVDSRDTKALSLVMEDFSRFHKNPSALAYKLCLKTYAALGDVQMVNQLFNGYLYHHVSKEHPIKDPDTLSPLLQVRSKLGQIDRVVEAFKDISEKYGLEPTIMSWNILINTYGKVHQYDQAFACFGQLLESPNVKPDEYTIGTLMGLCVNRGDFERVIETYHLAESLGVSRNATHMSCLVHAYIQEGRIEEAEKICVEAARTNLVGNQTQMWNNLLIGHAFRRDLKSANRILQLMSSLDVENDEWTYAALMQALTMAGQPNEALRIFAQVLPAAGYKPTPFHFAILMGGYVAVREHWKVFSLYDTMRREKMITTSTNFQLLRGRAVLDQKKFERGDLTEEERYQRTLRMFLSLVDSLKPQHLVGAKGMRRDPMDIRYPTSMYRYVMSVLSASNQADSALKFYERYQAALPPNRQGTVPLQMISVLAFAKWRARDHDGVEECWNLALATAKEHGSALPPLSSYWEKDDPENRSTSPQKRPVILQKHQIDLAKTLHTYMLVLAYRKDPDTMIQTVNSLLRDGFKLDMRNWNLYIELLIKVGQPKLAFEVCEKQLMPQWTGWGILRRRSPQRTRLPLEVRALRKDARWLRPLTQTLLKLTRAYLNIQAASSESKAYRFMLHDLERGCPLTMHAIQTLQRQDNNEERKILGDIY